MTTQLRIDGVVRHPCLGCHAEVTRQRDACKVLVGDVRRWCHLRCLGRYVAARWAQRQIDAGGAA